MPLATASYSEVRAALVAARNELSMALSKGHGTLYIQDRIKLLETRCKAM